MGYLSTVVFLCWPEAIILEFSKCCWGNMESVSCIYYCSRENTANPNALPHFEIFCRVKMKSGSSILDSIMLWDFMVCIVLGFTSGAFSNEYMNSIIYFSAFDQYHLGHIMVPCVHMYWSLIVWHGLALHRGRTNDMRWFNVFLRNQLEHLPRLSMSIIRIKLKHLWQWIKLNPNCILYLIHIQHLLLFRYLEQSICIFAGFTPKLVLMLSSNQKLLGGSFTRLWILLLHMKVEQIWITCGGKQNYKHSCKWYSQTQVLLNKFRVLLECCAREWTVADILGRNPTKRIID